MSVPKVFKAASLAEAQRLQDAKKTTGKVVDRIDGKVKK